MEKIIEGRYFLISEEVNGNILNYSEDNFPEGDLTIYADGGLVFVYDDDEICADCESVSTDEHEITVTCYDVNDRIVFRFSDEPFEVLEEDSYGN